MTHVCVTADRQSLAWAGDVEFSQAVMTNAPLVFTAGQGPFGPYGNVIGIGDPRAQIQQAFRNLGTVLEACGASLATVISQTVYLARADDFPIFKEIRREFFLSPFPAATTIRADLLVPGMLVEMSAVAAIGPERADATRPGRRVG